MRRSTRGTLGKHRLQRLFAPTASTSPRSDCHRGHPPGVPCPPVIGWCAEKKEPHFVPRNPLAIDHIRIPRSHRLHNEQETLGRYFEASFLQDFSTNGLLQGLAHFDSAPRKIEVHSWRTSAELNHQCLVAPQDDRVRRDPDAITCLHQQRRFPRFANHACHPSSLPLWGRCQSLRDGFQFASAERSFTAWSARSAAEAILPRLA